MNNFILNELLEAIKEKYGDLNNSRGCYINGVWLSIADIVELISEVDKYN